MGVRWGVRAAATLPSGNAAAHAQSRVNIQSVRPRTNTKIHVGIMAVSPVNRQGLYRCLVHARRNRTSFWVHHFLCWKQSNTFKSTIQFCLGAVTMLAQSGSLLRQAMPMLAQVATAARHYQAIYDVGAYLYRSLSSCGVPLHKQLLMGVPRRSYAQHAFAC
jgi:hypothetical protein